MAPVLSDGNVSKAPKTPTRSPTATPTLTPHQGLTFAVRGGSDAAREAGDSAAALPVSLGRLGLKAPRERHTEQVPQSSAERAREAFLAREARIR